MRCQQLVLLLIAGAVAVEAANRTVLLTGATGRTGSLIYPELKKAGLTVRALVRNVTKARLVLGCNACDHSEGIFVGDILKPETLAPAVQGVDVLMLTVGPVVQGCKYGPLDSWRCKYPPGDTPKELSWEGVENEVGAFLKSSGSALADRHVIHLSGGFTTIPDNFLDKIAKAHMSFYSLNGQSFLMSSGVPFTIVQACHLGTGAGGKSKMVVAHDDQLPWYGKLAISRADVARVLVAAAANPEQSKGLRFNLCSAFFGKPTIDANELFQEAMYDWDPRKHSSSTVVV